jgi:hypothetical protein
VRDKGRVEAYKKLCNMSMPPLIYTYRHRGTQETRIFYFDASRSVSQSSALSSLALAFGLAYNAHR